MSIKLCQKNSYALSVWRKNVVNSKRQVKVLKESAENELVLRKLIFRNAHSGTVSIFITVKKQRKSGCGRNKKVTN